MSYLPVLANEQPDLVYSGVLKGLTYGGSQFMAVAYDFDNGESNAYVSSDGVAWGNIYTFNGYVENVVYANGMFFTSKAHTGSGFYSSSNGGASWTLRNSGEFCYLIGSANDYLYFYTGSGVFRTNDGVNYTAVTATTFNLRSVAFNGSDTYIAISDSSIEVSSNGTVFTDHTPTDVLGVYGVVWHEPRSRFVSMLYSVAASGRRFAESSDGITWEYRGDTVYTGVGLRGLVSTPGCVIACLYGLD